MNHFKMHIKKDWPTISHFLTYADNYAIGYFKKQVKSELLVTLILPLSDLRYAHIDIGIQTRDHLTTRTLGGIYQRLRRGHTYAGK